MRRVMWWVSVIGVVALMAGGCSSDSNKKSTKKKSTTTTEQAASSSSAAKKQQATAAPTEGLADGATVTVTVTGFTADKTLGINQCAETQGDPEVGADDCDLSGIKTLTVGADGTGTGTIDVKKTPASQTAHTCGGTTRCFLSIGELTADANAERADDVNITFTG